MSDFVFVVNCSRIRKTSTYIVDFPYNEQLVNRIKELPRNQRKFNGQYKVWEISVSGLSKLIKSYSKSKKIFFNFGEYRDVFIEQLKKSDQEEKEKELALQKLVEDKKLWIEYKRYLEENFQKYKDKLHSYLKPGIKLYNHQVVASMFVNKVRNVLLSHEMGLGKTIISIVYCEMNEFEKVFVITPNSLKFNYYYEVLKFTNSKAHVVGWNKNKFSIEESKYIIVNYEFFNTGDKKKFDAKWKKLGIDVIDCLIADECHRLKSTKTNTYKNYNRIFTDKFFRNKVVSKVFMSGTPAPNRAYELYAVMHQISPLDFPTKEHFYEYYCGMTYDFTNGWGYLIDEENTKFEELYHKIAPYTHRKRKSDTDLNLPEKIYQRLWLEMTQKQEKEYAEIEEISADELETALIGSTPNQLVILGRLRQYLSNIKIGYLSDVVNDILNNTNEKVVIVDIYKNSLFELKKIFKDVAGLHTGDQSVVERSEIVKKFQDPNSDLRVFLGTVQTCNYGLTLTQATKMFIITLPFVPGEYDQVADRCILKGELVLTKNGYKPIETVNVGDYVYTHKGNWKKILYKTNKIERSKAFYDVKYKGFYKPLRCTQDHKIYVYDYEKSTYYWVEASKLNIMKHGMVFPKINVNNYNNIFQVEKHESKIHNKLNINLKPKLCNSLLYAFGRYVGDGHVNDHQISICGHIDEYYDVLSCIKTIKNAFNILNHTEYNRDNKIEIYISSIELRNNFKRWFGSGAHNKKIPDFIFQLEYNQIESFLMGYYDADGYVRKNTQQASTVSKYLSYQLLLLEGLLGNLPTLRFSEHAKCWSIEYSIQSKMKRSSLIKNISGNVIYPIQDIKIYKPKRYDEVVYDLTVEDDESFIIGLSSVHNCHRIGQKNIVNIYALMFPDTIDENTYGLIESKRGELSTVIDNEKYNDSAVDSVLGDVVKNILKKHGKKV